MKVYIVLDHSQYFEDGVVGVFRNRRVAEVEIKRIYRKFPDYFEEGDLYIHETELLVDLSR